MRLMLILFGASAFVYLVSGAKGWLTTRARLYFAIGTFILAYLATMLFVQTGSDL